MYCYEDNELGPPSPSAMRFVSLSLTACGLLLGASAVSLFENSGLLRVDIDRSTQVGVHQRIAWAWELLGCLFRLTISRGPKRVSSRQDTGMSLDTT